MLHILKRFTAAALVFALAAALLTGCAGRNTIKVYSEGDYLDPALLAAFTEETGIKVKYITGNRTPNQEQKEEQAQARAQTDGDAQPLYTSANAVLSEKAAAQKNTDDSMSLREILLSTRQQEETATSGDAAAYTDANAATPETDGNAQQEKKYKAPAYDVVLTDSDTLSELSNCGLLLPLSKEDIPNLETINPEWTDPTDHPERAYSVACLWETVGLLWNTELLQEQQKSWDTLWNEEYSGQILMPNQQRTCLSVALSALGLDPNSTDPEALQAAYDKLAEQKPLVAAYTDGEAYALMENGFAAIMPCGSGDALAIMQYNPGLAFMLPAEGSFRLSYGYAVTADTRKADAAKQFVDYMCSATNLAKNAVYSKYSVTSDEAVSKLDSTWQNNPLAYPPGTVTSASPLLTGLTPEARAVSAVRWEKLTEE